MIHNLPGSRAVIRFYDWRARAEGSRKRVRRAKRFAKNKRESEEKRRRRERRMDYRVTVTEEKPIDSRIPNSEFECASFPLLLLLVRADSRRRSRVFRELELLPSKSLAYFASPWLENNEEKESRGETATVARERRLNRKRRTRARREIVRRLSGEGYIGNRDAATADPNGG